MTRYLTWMVATVLLPVLGLSGCLNPAVDDGAADDEPPAQNRAPVANAGLDRSVRTGQQTTMAGLGTDVDGDPLSYQWSVLRSPFGSNVALYDATSPTPSFVPAKDGLYELQLVVSDGSEESEDTVQIRSSARPADQNGPPQADAGPDLRTEVGREIPVRGRGSDPDADALTYQWTLADAPAGGRADLGRINSATASFSADLPGTYRLQLVVSDTAASSEPDSTRITVAAPDGDDGGGDGEPGKGPPLANAYAWTALEINDDFSDGDRSGSLMHPEFWRLEAERNAAVVETASKLRITSTGGTDSSGGLRSTVSERLNFFRQALRVSVTGLQFSGTADDREQSLTVAFTSERRNSLASEDAIALTLHGDGRLLLSFKENAPGQPVSNGTVLVDRHLGAVPATLHLVVDQSSFRIEIGDGIDAVADSGYHGLRLTAWGPRGDSALGLDGRFAAAGGDGTSVVELDAVAVKSLPVFDEFSNDRIRDNGHQPGFWQSEESGDTTLSESADGLEVAAGGGGTPYGRLYTPVLRRLNFFAQPLVFSADLDFPPADSRTIATFALSSSTEEHRSTPDVLLIDAGDDGRLRLTTRWSDGGSERRLTLLDTTLPSPVTRFELRLDRQRYAFRAYGGFGTRSYSGAHDLPFYAWGIAGDSSLSVGARSADIGDDGTAIARWESVRVLRDQPDYIAGTVFGPVGDGVALDVPELPADQSLLHYGILDVSKAPFHADPAGDADSTEALRSAARYAQQHHLVVYFPAGRYRVTETIDCTQGLYLRTTERLIGHREEGPCVFIGSRAGARRPTIFLTPGSEGFGDPGRPRPVVDFRARSYKSSPEQEQPNTSINQMFVNLDIEIGADNAGAIGIELQGAQGSGIQEATIDATHGYIGVRGGSGSGGSHANVTIIGGVIGLDLSDAQPNPTIVGITLIDQARHAIHYIGTQTLTAVGIRIRSSRAMQGAAINVPDMNGNWSAVVGQIALIDSSIEFTGAATGGTAVTTSRSIYLENVWIGNASVLVNNFGAERVSGNAAGWSHVREYAHGDTPPPFLESGKTYQYQMPLYLDGQRTLSTLSEVDAEGTPPPADLQSRHLWGSRVPGWESSGAVNVMEPPYNARGDGVSDDTDAIQRAVDAGEIVFLPKGYFRVTRPIRLRANTQLVGVSRNLSTLIAAQSAAFGDAQNPQPVVQTSTAASAQSQVAFLTLQAPAEVPGAYALDWQSGRDSIFRNVNIQQRSTDGHGGRPGTPAARDRSTPLVQISGNGGGRFYNLYQESAWYQTADYRHLLVSGTREPLRFYQLNPEHAQSDANVEIRDAANVDIFGIKSEGNYALLWIRDSADINVYGFGGNSSPFAASEGYPSGFADYTPSIVRIERTPRFRLVNVVDYGRMSGDDPIFGVGVAADRWHAILERPAAGGTLLSRPLDRPVLVRRGE